MFSYHLLLEIHVHRSLETTLAMCKVEIFRTLGKVEMTKYGALVHLGNQLDL